MFHFKIVFSVQNLQKKLHWLFGDSKKIFFLSARNLKPTFKVSCVKKFCINALMIIICSKRKCIKLIAFYLVKSFIQLVCEDKKHDLILS